MRKFRTQVRLLALFLGLAGAAGAVSAKEMTAFDLAKAGNQYIGDQSKDRIVQIRSEKSVGATEPDVWYVVYYDPDATLKAVEVKFGAGQKMGVKRPIRLLEPLTRAEEPLSKDKLKIDSDQALKIAMNEPLLAKLTLKSSRLILERRSYDDPTPVWKIRLWAAKLKNPNDSADIGEVIVSATDGTILKSGLSPEAVD